MIDRNALRGVITAKGKTQKDVAIHMNLTPKTFYAKMKKGVFGSDEIEVICDYLGIEKPAPIFFPKWVN